MSAKVKILIEGYTNADSKAESGGEEKSCATVSLVLDENMVMVVDPGVLESQQILIDALKNEDLSIDDVNMVCITHSHIDHYRNIGMFPNAKVLEFFGLWNKNQVEDWSENFAPNIQVVKTPGHDYTGITLFVKTDDGVVAICGDVFWKENYPEKPADDMYASDFEKLEQSRKLVLKKADFIIPGHAGIYKINKTEVLKDEVSAEQGEIKKPEIFAICRHCKRAVYKKEDMCLCQTYLCYRCCQCDLNCSYCVCKQRKF
jgi:glyoxylase-like metal-dependent hydrolase (beta-lactamase superfamily II)